MKAISDRADTIQGSTQHGSEVAETARFAGAALEVSFVPSRRDPGLVWYARGVRTRRHIITAHFHQPRFLLLLLGQNVAENAPFLDSIVLAGGAQLVQHPARHEGSSHDLGGGMIVFLPGCRPEILEDGDILEA